VFLLLAYLILAGSPDGLTTNIQLYWDALQIGDKARALQFVYPDDLNNFINRREARFESWKLLQVELRSENEAQVGIQLQRFLPNGVVGPVKGHETWVKTEEGWRVRVEASGKQYQELIGGAREKEGPPSLPKRLEISPRVINFYALFPDQPRLLHILNGLDIPVDGLEIEVDPERFEILSRPDKIEPRAKGLIKILYIGKEEGENLEDRFLLRVHQGGDTKEVTVPVVCNYMDPAARWLMKLEGQKRQEP
jgi:hypothetical protein